MIITSYINKYPNAKPFFINENFNIQQNFINENDDNNNYKEEEGEVNFNFWDDMLLLTTIANDDVLVYAIIDEDKKDELFNKIIENKWKFNVKVKKIDTWDEETKNIFIKKLKKEKVKNKSIWKDKIEIVKTTIPINYICDLSQILN